MKGSKKPRKQRTVKNSIVSVDDVDVAPGPKYTNWIDPVRSKLAERETKLTTIRLGICRNIILRSVDEFTAASKRYFIDIKQKTTVYVDRMGKVNHEMADEYLSTAALNQIKDKCAEMLKETLNEWQGVRRNIQSEEKEETTFRRYFGFCKNWFDQVKLEHMTFDFWVPIFELVEQCALTAAAKFFCHRFSDIQAGYSEFLRLLILENLIRGTLKLPNSRERLLIPAGVFVKIRKNLSVLNVPGHKIQSLKSRTGSKEIRELILNTIISIKDAAKCRFFKLLCALHDEVDHYHHDAAKPMTAPMVTRMVKLEEPRTPKLENMDFKFFPDPFKLNNFNSNPFSQMMPSKESDDGESSTFRPPPPPFSCCSSSTTCTSINSVGALSGNAFSDRDSDDSWSKVSVNQPDFMVPVSDSASICDAPIRYYSSTFRHSPSQSVRYAPY